MHRRLNLRQIEAFKAVVESGTVSRAAVVSNISQPAMSKLIAHLEADTGLNLFDRVKGRLAPTDQGMRLYEEIGRLFAGVRQVENAVDAIRREEQGRLAVGVMTALAGSFIQRTTTEFLSHRPNVFCSIHTLSSPWTVDRLIARKLDIGLVNAPVENPYVTLEPLLEQPLVCIMPQHHPLATVTEIGISDLEGRSFVAFDSDIYLSHLVESTFDRYGVRPAIALIANTALTVCEFVAAGLGVSLVHPLMASGLEHRLVVRRFTPDIWYSFQLCRGAENRNSKLIDAFAQQLRETAAQVSSSLLD